MLDDTNIIQTNQGSTGASAPVTTFDMTLPSPVTDGNVLIAIAAKIDWLRSVVVPDATWLKPFNITESNGIPAFSIWTAPAPGGVSTFTWGVDGTGGIICWFLMEMSSYGSALEGVDPFDGVTPTGTPRFYDANAGRSGTAFASGTTCDTQTSTAPNSWGDDLILSAGVGQVASGTPPLLFGIADTTGGQPGTWARLGSTVATSRVSGVNIRLDVFRKYSGGVQHLFDATYTWASAVATACAGFACFKSNWIAPQQANPRQSTNSTM